MSRYTRIRSFLVFVVPFLLPAAKAGSIVVDPTVSGSSGAYSYSYEVENDTPIGILLFSLAVTGDVGTITSPLGWVPATSVIGIGETLVEWVSADMPYDVPASGALSGFSFTSDSESGIVPFSTFDENFSEFDGLTTGPVASAAVPEPTGFVLLGLGLIGTFTELLRVRRLLL